MKKIWVIAKNTSKEIFRDRILYGLLIFAAFLVLFSLLLGELSFVEQARIVTNMGLVAAQFGCGMLAIFVGSSLVWREIEKQTVLTLLSKPVTRSQFLMGKFLGLCIVILVTDLLISIFLGFVCHFFGSVYWNQFIICEAATFLESLFLLSLAMFFGVFCRPVLTTLFTMSIWFVGHGVNDLHYFSEKSKHEVLKNVGLFLSRVLPNLDFFSFKESVIYGDVIAAGDIRRALILWISWSLILFIGTSFIFEKRDFI